MKKIFFILFMAAAQLRCSIASAEVITGITYPDNTGLPDNPELVSGVLNSILNWTLGIIGTLAILMFIVSGVKYVLANGDPKEAESAKKIMTYSIIGLVVALLGYVIVNTIDSVLN